MLAPALMPLIGPRRTLARTQDQKRGRVTSSKLPTLYRYPTIGHRPFRPLPVSMGDEFHMIDRASEHPRIARKERGENNSNSLCHTERLPSWPSIVTKLSDTIQSLAIRPLILCWSELTRPLVQNSD